jgi:hypothetical protein
VAAANLALRFLLELAGVASLAYWGFHASGSTPVRIALAIAAPAVLVVVWAIVVAPGAENALPQFQRMVIGTALLELAAVALAVAGQRTAGIVLGVLILVNAVLMAVLGE